MAQLQFPNKSVIDSNFQQDIEAKQNSIQQLPDLLNRGILDRETFDLRTYKLRSEIAELETKIAQLPPGNLKAIAQAVSIEQFWARSVRIRKTLLFSRIY